MSTDGFSGLLAYGKNSTKDEFGSLQRSIAVVFFYYVMFLLVTSFQDNDVKTFGSVISCQNDFAEIIRENSKRAIWMQLVSARASKTAGAVGFCRLRFLLES